MTKIYVTKYALSTGVFCAEAEIKEDGRMAASIVKQKKKLESITFTISDKVSK